MKSNKGFSLVELIVVIAIMAIIAGVAIPVFSGYIDKANKGADADFMAQVQYAVRVANAGDATFVLGDITVAIDANGNPSSVTYGGNTVEEDTDDEVLVDIAGVVDWDYTFKAYSSSAKITAAGVVSGT